MAGIQRDYVFRIERRELSVDRRSLASLESQTIPKVRKVVFICEFQENPPGIGSRGVEQLRKQEAASGFGLVPGVRGIYAFVNLIALRSDESVGASDKLSEVVGALS